MGICIGVYIWNRIEIYEFQIVNPISRIRSIKPELSHCKPLNSTLKINMTRYPYIRNTTCNCCFQHNYKYLINNENICKLNVSQEKIDLFIIIFTNHTNFITRQVIRETWLTIAKNNTANVRYAFLLGRVNNVKLEESIAMENNKTGDIIMEDFTDTYQNLTLKTMMGFKWVVNFCKTARFVMKTDDDMFINVPNLLNYLRTYGEESKNQLMGSCSTDGPIRNQTSKWYTSIEEYEEKRYPPHCSGTGYFTSFSIIEQIYKISQYVPFFWLEDIYVSLCFIWTNGTVKHISGFYRSKQKLDPCLFKGNSSYTSHKVTPTMLRMIWATNCSKLKY